MAFFCCGTGCQNTPETKNAVPDTSTTKGMEDRVSAADNINHELENSITDSLLKLPIVIKANEHIDSISKHKHGITFIFDRIEKNENEIAVKAGYNNTERFETYYLFFIEPKSFEIKVYDAVNDLKVPLKDFIK